MLMFCVLIFMGCGGSGLALNLRSTHCHGNHVNAHVRGYTRSALNARPFDSPFPSENLLTKGKKSLAQLSAGQFFFKIKVIIIHSKYCSISDWLKSHP